MKKFIIAMVLVLSLSSSVFAGEVIVAAAANLAPVMDELKAAFEKESQDTVKVITGSSGKLTAQIENGAPFDVFLSADMEYPRTVYNEGLAVDEPKIYAYGVLVLWTMKDMNLAKGVAVISDARVKKVALANPQTAPYGREAVYVLESLGLYPLMEDKLVYGESVSQVSQFVVSFAADIGFTAKSIVVAANMKDKGNWIEVDPGFYHPMAQGAVILKYGQQHHRESAMKFFEFLFGAQAREILKKYGYSLP